MKELQALFDLKFPNTEKRSDTFFDIIQQKTRETTISRVYAYFLDKSRNKHISNCFIESLLELIQDKSSKSLQILNPTCRLEVKTANDNRIDLYIESSESGAAIIIENKVHHKLDNDLLDYWNYCNVSAEKKIGILLTLNHCYIPDSYRGMFISITHLEWINRAIAKGVYDNISAEKNVYLKDFINNMKNLSEGNDFNEQTRFYFNNINLINKAVDTEKMAKKYVLEQLRIVANLLGGNWKLSDGTDKYQQIWDGQKAYYTIITDSLYNGSGQIGIIIELYSWAKESEVVRSLRTLLYNDEAYRALKKDGIVDKHYVHFVYEYYPVSVEELAELGNFITSKIEMHFRDVMDKVLEHLRHYHWGNNNIV